MAQTSGRYVMDKTGNTAVMALYNVWSTRDEFDFLRGWDPREDVDRLAPGEGITHNQHILLVGRAAKTLEGVITRGGTAEEFERATKFALIVLDSEKHLLDTEQAKVKYGFKELEDKYARGIQE